MWDSESNYYYFLCHILLPLKPLLLLDVKYLEKLFMKTFPKAQRIPGIEWVLWLILQLYFKAEASTSFEILAKQNQAEV